LYKASLLRLIGKNDAAEGPIDSLAACLKWPSGCGKTTRNIPFILKFISRYPRGDAMIILVLANICESGFSRFFGWLFAFGLASLPLCGDRD
jgi:hypothetical protein